MLVLYSLLFLFELFDCISGVRQTKRAIFPQSNPTRVQIIAGFGIPIDLKLESVIIGYVFKAQYFLPYNSSQFYQQSFTPIRIQRDNVHAKKTMFGHNKYEADNSFWDEYNQQKSSFDNANSRWILYKSLETLMEMKGFNGRQCMLRGICEVAEKPFSRIGLFNELLQIALTPSKTNDQIHNRYELEYFHAEMSGQNGDPCDRMYSGCSRSPLDMISATFLNNLNY